MDEHPVLTPATEHALRTEAAFCAFGMWSHGNDPSMAETILLLEEYVARLRTAWADNPGDAAAADVLRKVVAIGVRQMNRKGMAVPRDV